MGRLGQYGCSVGIGAPGGVFLPTNRDRAQKVGPGLAVGGIVQTDGTGVSGLYPGSMVGVPGDRLSNMAPPTFVIVALLVFQIGVAEVTRPAVETRLQGSRWRQINALINRFALPLFLFHTTAMALVRAVDYFFLEGRIVDDRSPDLIWWLERPLAVLGPLLFILPVIVIFARHRPSGHRAA
jgi:hypothetical protein